MKRIIFLLAFLFAITGAFAQQDKDIATKTFKVEGTCNMCKKRIEDAAYGKGVKHAEWNKQAHTVTVVYRPSRTSDTAIAARIAHAGHNNDLVQVKESDYKKLPDCCAYKTTVCEH